MGLCFGVGEPNLQDCFSLPTACCPPSYLLAHERDLPRCTPSPRQTSPTQLPSAFTVVFRYCPEGNLCPGAWTMGEGVVLQLLNLKWFP